MNKTIDQVKSLGIDDKTTSSLITVAYNYYQTKEIDKKVCTKKEYVKLISCFVRFFRSINSTKQNDDELIQHLKLESLKGKNESLNLVTKYIAEIRQVQSSKILFGSPDLTNTLNPINNKNYNRGRHIRNLVNFDYKIDSVNH